MLGGYCSASPPAALSQQVGGTTFHFPAGCRHARLGLVGVELVCRMGIFVSSEPLSHVTFTPDDNEYPILRPRKISGLGYDDGAIALDWTM